MIVTSPHSEASRNTAFARGARPSQKPLYVLVADADRDSRETLAVLLTLAGHTVRIARDGEEALRVARAFQPGIIFLDIRMPRLNGYEVCRRLRWSPCCYDSSIFALSSLSGAEHERLCREAGFTAQLMKPLEPSALYELCATKRTRRQKH